MSTLVHFITGFNDRTGAEFACTAPSGTGKDNPGRVTCFACRRSSVFKREQALTEASRPAIGDTYHFADPVTGKPTCGATLTKWVSPLPTHDRAGVNCPVCLSVLAGGHPPVARTDVRPSPPFHKMPLMNAGDDGIFTFFDVHVDGNPLELVPQLSGNVEITLGETLFTLSHLDRANMIRALLHDFHYSPERGGPNGQD